MILVTASTGKFGGATAQYLLQKNIPFKAAARNMETLKKQFGNEVEIVSFDWEKPATFTDILQGITTVYLMPPPVVTNDFHITATPFIETPPACSMKPKQ